MSYSKNMPFGIALYRHANRQVFPMFAARFAVIVLTRANSLTAHLLSKRRLELRPHAPNSSALARPQPDRERSIAYAESSKWYRARE